MQYHVELLLPRFFTRTLNKERLAAVLNERAAEGWTFARSITDSRRKWLLFKREAHFLIFSRDASGSAPAPRESMA